jgi:glycosyltransferase involved in cell wall biosynthesis
MKIAIIGTRGIPNNYGGFEQCAEYLAVILAKEGYEVTVYNSHKHPFQGNKWKEVNIVHQYDPEDRLGTLGQFIYDFNCILDCRQKDFDIILQLGYTSNSVWGWMLPKKRSIITTNMDGLEWKRSKYSKPVQRFLRYAESLAVKHSDYLISDSVGIKDYLQKKYNVDSDFIPYGANLFVSPDKKALVKYELIPYNYNILIARLEPENNIETILDGYVSSRSRAPFLVVGGTKTKYGQYITAKYRDHAHIRFLGGIYDIDVLNNLRYYSNFYFHGHTVGGTNPSLLEAMASNALICAHDNVFNKSILNTDAYYFKTAGDVEQLINNASPNFKMQELNQGKLANNSTLIQKKYSWSYIGSQYIQHFKSLIYNNSLMTNSKEGVLRHEKMNNKELAGQV